MQYQLNTNFDRKSNIISLLRSLPKSPVVAGRKSFTGTRVKQAGKNLGVFSLIISQGDAKSLDLGLFAQGHPDHLEARKLMNRSVLSGLCLITLISVLFPWDAWAHTGDLFKEEIGKMEQLFTGGYMRLGLLGVCGVTAIAGAVKQNAWMFISGILAGVFAFFMKDWILKTFSQVI
ncbi:MAG: hypothetical protein HOI80_03230 [Alphaproteobacteria bacterium]|jgi:hypothetical protein|nr:hypothetical protein [Alphaproteobacteria bacterium]MBT5389496.1 hypothetical protein [Alphaproteobacteria bacterium]MBT5540485.1 hypothetical protein [Alphaproteobacteria bacterium]MBT5654497.1 hypothetical protein [Alphaproteobacteria bacterium]